MTELKEQIDQLTEAEQQAVLQYVHQLLQSRSLPAGEEAWLTAEVKAQLDAFLVELETQPEKNRYTMDEVLEHARQAVAEAKSRSKSS